MRVRSIADVKLLAWGPLALLALTVASAGGYPLSAVEIDKAAGQTTLTLRSSEQVRYEVFRLDTPDRIVLDLLGADAPVEPVITGSDPTGWFGEARCGLWRDEPDGRVVRYVIETGSPATYDVNSTDDGLRICVSNAGTESIGHPAAPPIEEPATPLAQDELELDLAPSLGAADPAAAIVPALVGQSDVPATKDLSRPTMNLDVQGADIKTVLRSISEFGKVNIIPDREVTGPVSVRLVQVPWREALDLVCASAGLIAVDRGDVIRVADRKTIFDEDLERESTARKREELIPLETAILAVKYANADELKKSVSFVLSKRGNAEVDMRTNSILVTDIPERLAQIRGMVDELDSETLQVEIVAKLVDVDVTAARQLGISWNIENLHSNSERVSGSISHSTPLATSATDLRFGVIRPFGNLDGVIQALERDNKANIISNPSITTTNNRQARILVGKQVPLIVLDQSGNPITELKKVGITLEVTPYINSENKVTMDLHPEVSDLSSQATVQGGIVFTTTEADTRVMVADGETAVIGGLISQSETRFEEGIPILKNIPLLGRLFRSSDVRKANRELMIFVTPRIVRSLASLEPH